MRMKGSNRKSESVGRKSFPSFDGELLSFICCRRFSLFASLLLFDKKLFICDDFYVNASKMKYQSNRWQHFTFFKERRRLSSSSLQSIWHFSSLISFNIFPPSFSLNSSRSHCTPQKSSSRESEQNDDIVWEKFLISFYYIATLRWRWWCFCAINWNLFASSSLSALRLLELQFFPTFLETCEIARHHHDWRRTTRSEWSCSSSRKVHV